MTRLYHLTSLTVIGSITSFPDSIGQLTQLTYLFISGNLTSLPDNIAQLTKLTHLDISQNKLKSLPDSIGQLTQLTHLDISHNELTSLPDSVGELTKLTHLDINKNKLTSLLDSIGQLAQLTYLDISYNRSLHTLPVSLHNISTLEELNCHECEALTSPPYTVCKQGIEAVFKYLGVKKLECSQILTPATAESQAGKATPRRSSQHNKHVLKRSDSTVKSGISSDLAIYQFLPKFASVEPMQKT